MKVSNLYEGVLGESISDAIPQVIKKEKELNKEVFLLWNGAILRVTKDSTYSKLLLEYERQLHKIDLANKESRGEVFTLDQIKEKVNNLLVNTFKNGKDN